MHGDSCYFAEPVAKTYDIAGKWCTGSQSRFLGNLVSISSQEEQEFIDDLVNEFFSQYSDEILSDSDKRFWIGLELDETGVPHWADGLNVTYTNFNPPLSFSNSKTLCVDAYYFVEGNEGSWAADDCSEESFFICEAPPLDVQRTCPEGFNLFEDSCFKIGDLPQIYSSSQQYCASFDPFAHLAVVPDARTEQILLQLATQSAPDADLKKFWIGLKDFGAGYSYWSTGAQAANGFQYFDSEKAVVPLKCVAMSLDSNATVPGSWETSNCLDEYFPICELSAQTVLIDCPDGYKYVDGQCFRTYNEPTQATLAGEVCKDSGADVLQIRTEEEQKLINSLETNGTFWLGLLCPEASDCSWLGFDVDEPLDYSNWESPNASFLGDCGVIDFDNEGKWAHARCGDEHSYICSGMPHETPVCPPNYTRVDSACYHIHNEPANFSEAEDYCEQENAHLITITNSDTNDAFQELVTTYLQAAPFILDGQDFWIGLSDPDQDGSYTTWQDGTKWPYRYWIDPMNVAPGGCVEATFAMMSPADDEYGGWVPVNCNLKKRFVCQRIPTYAAPDLPSQAPTLSPSKATTAAPTTTDAPAQTTTPPGLFPTYSYSFDEMNDANLLSKQLSHFSAFQEIFKGTAQKIINPEYIIEKKSDLDAEEHGPTSNNKNEKVLSDLSDTKIMLRTNDKESETAQENALSTWSLYCFGFSTLLISLFASKQLGNARRRLYSPM